jgi:hypothetical protein
VWTETLSIKDNIIYIYISWLNRPLSKNSIYAFQLFVYTFNARLQVQNVDINEESKVFDIPLYKPDMSMSYTPTLQENAAK